MLRAEAVVPEVFRCTTRSISNVMLRAMSWIWDGWIPRGSLSLVLGEPGVGKSLYGLQLAAMVTRGWLNMPTAGGSAEPDQSTSNRGLAGAGSGVGLKGGTTVLFEAGDSASILRSRLDLAGAEIEKIVLVERNWRGDALEEEEEFLQSEPREPAKRPSRMEKDRELRRDLESLEQHVVQLRHTGHDVSLVVIDPIESLLRDSVDPYRLAKLLSELADRLNVAMVAVGTTSSTPRAYPGLRLDSKGIDALFKASTTVITVVRDLENEQQRIVLPTKLNLSASPPGVMFRFTSDGSLEWSQATTPLTGEDDQAQVREPRQGADQLTSRQNGSGKELNRAMQWLHARLSQGGVPVTTLRSDARGHGISKATLRRAYDELGCVSKKSLGSGQWLWWLPESMEPESPHESPADAHQVTRLLDSSPRINGNGPGSTL